MLTSKIAAAVRDRKSTRLNSSHLGISYAVFCLKKREDLLQHRDPLHPPPSDLDHGLQQEVEKGAEARPLRTQAGGGALPFFAFVLIIFLTERDPTGIHTLAQLAFPPV